MLHSSLALSSTEHNISTQYANQNDSKVQKMHLDQSKLHLTVCYVSNLQIHKEKKHF